MCGPIDQAILYSLLGKEWIMKFGFHTQMNNWQHQATHTQMLDDIREQVQLCEQLGFDAV